MSEIRATTVSDLAGSGPVTLTKQSAAKAWGHASYSAGTPISDDGLNVSSLTDISAGYIGWNLTSSFSSANYAAFSLHQSNSSDTSSARGVGTTSSKLETINWLGGTTLSDTPTSMAALGDLA